MKFKLYTASVFGEILTWYDFTLYSFLAPVFATLFFPAGDAIASLINTYAIFAIGFISRPLGGLFFGTLGDRYGRRYAFIASIIMMALTTLGIGLLPTYEQIGLIAPVLLLCLRLIQGFSCGGEFSGSMVFLAEHAEPQKYFFVSSLTWCGTMIGTLLASLVVTLLSFNQQFLHQFGFRIPFLIGAAFAIIGIYLRMHLNETPVFLELKERGLPKVAILKTIVEEWKNSLKIIAINVPLAVLSYGSIAFLPSYLSQFLHFSLNDTFLINTFIFALLMISIPIAAKIADKIGGKRIFLFSLLLTILLFLPAFLLFSSNHFYSALLGSVLIAIPGCCAMAVTPGLSAEIVAPSKRAMIMSFAYNVTYCVFGGTAPLIAVFGIEQMHSVLFPALYIILFALCGLILNIKTKTI